MAVLGKDIDIILAPHGAERSFSIRLPVLVLVVVLTLLVLLIMTGAIGILTYSKVLSRAMRADALIAQNDSLRTQLSRITVLESEMADLIALKGRVLELAGSQPGMLEPLVSRKGPPLGSDADMVSKAESAVALLQWDESNPQFVWPVYGPISQGFKVGSKKTAPHPGIDIAANTGTPVLCVESGEVTYAGEDSVFGKLVIMDHGNGITSWYGHNSRLAVIAGQRMKKGSVIAFVGNTGVSTAPHLHLEIRKNGVPFDPTEYLCESPMAKRKRK
jgi:murein DD-endopeptidase MepM/ murein hydrolase activator NlpD